MIREVKVSTLTKMLDPTAPSYEEITDNARTGED